VLATLHQIRVILVVVGIFLLFIGAIFVFVSIEVPNLVNSLFMSYP
jgi:hypothetical protein